MPIGVDRAAEIRDARDSGCGGDEARFGQGHLLHVKFVARSVPLVLATCPSELTVPSKSAMPEIPAAGSMKPDSARFIFCTLTLWLAACHWSWLHAHRS